MNTNNNVYTVVYTTVICVLVAALLAFVSQTLKQRQLDNEKAETISQILCAAQFGEKDELSKKGNQGIISLFKDEIDHSILVDAKGKEVKTLGKDEVVGTSELKAQTYNFKNKSYQVPVYIFKNGVHVFPIYGAGLWGPIWGYIAVDESLTNIVGAYFDHASETPGLGGKIKDDPKFRAQFKGKALAISTCGASCCEAEASAKAFEIVKGGAPAGMDNGVDAISGATMTCKGLDAAINDWVNAYKSYILAAEEE